VTFTTARPRLNYAVMSEGVHYCGMSSFIGPYPIYYRCWRSAVSSKGNPQPWKFL